MTGNAPFPDRPPLRTWVAHGLRCAIVRAPIWDAINGYVLAGSSFTTEMADQVNVHGGITWHGDEWVGFDTLHSGDSWPGVPRSPYITCTRTWTEDEVVAETERLAAEVKRVSEL